MKGVIKIETRQMIFESDFKVRSDNNDKYIEGYFIRYNEETKLTEGMYEEIKPEAVINSLKTNDIRCLFNHDTAVVLGRTGNNTLELRSDDKGLWGRVKVNDNDKQANDIYARIERGDINACSFGFIPITEEIENRDDGSVKFIVKDVDLKEVSAVTFPAYPTTMVQARNEDVKHHEERKIKAKKEQLREMLSSVKTVNVTTQD